MNSNNTNESKGFFQKFLTSYRVTFLLIIGLALTGIFTLKALPRESTPEIKVPFGIIVTAYPGASTNDVEELVTDPIEKKIKNLAGLKETTSSSRVGISTINVEFSADYDVDDSLRKLREEVNKIHDLPDEAETPQVIEINFSNKPIITLSLGGIEDERLLTIYAEKLADNILNISNVADTTVVGARKKEISIKINPTILAKYKLSINQVLGSIKAANINAPFGQLKTDNFNYTLRLEEGFNNIGDVAAISIKTPIGRTVTLDQIADISLQISEKNSGSRISLNSAPSTAAVSISVTKKTGGNIIDIIKQVKKEVKSAQQTFLPDNIVVEYFADMSEEINDSLNNVARSGLQTLVIVISVLWLFLGWKEALITSLAIPLTFFISFIVFDITDTTLNSVSLFSLILSLGLLVDNAIVIIEGIHTGTGQPNLRRHAAKIIDRFKKPLIGGTMTTVAAFFPMLLTSGIIGEFLKVIPTVVTATLISSLFVSLAFIPAVAVQILKKNKPQEKTRWFDRKFASFKIKYSSFISWLLHHRRFQNWMIGILSVLLVIGLSLPFTGLLKTGLFPNVDVDFIVVNFELPPGSRLVQSVQVGEKIEKILLQEPTIKSFTLNTGSSTNISLGENSNSENLGSLFINLNKKRKESSLQVSSRLRKDFDQIPEAKIIIEELSAGPPTAPPVEVKVIGHDIKILDQLSKEIANDIKTIPGAIEIDRNIRTSAGEFTFKLNNQALADNNLTAGEIANFLRVMIYGVESTTFLDEHTDEISVTVEASQNNVDSIDKILSLPITTATGKTIILSQVANVKLETSFDSIKRRNSERTVSITANTNDTTTPNQVSSELKKIIENKQLPNDYRVEFGGEQKETENTFAELYRSMLLAVILILVILVIEFNSYRQPLIIFLSVPMALIGVLFGLLIFGGQLNFAAFIGLVSLTGIVVNNAILLVDRMNNLYSKGVSLIEAVKKSAESRLRPILLTTITTAAGIAPLIWVDEFFRDVAITLITGLTFSAILTLVFIPVLYLRQQQKIEYKASKKNNL